MSEIPEKASESLLSAVFCRNFSVGKFSILMRSWLSKTIYCSSFKYSPSLILGNVRLAESSLPRSQLAGEVPPPLRISQRMKLEASQLDGVNKRIKVRILHIEHFSSSSSSSSNNLF